MVFLVVLTSLGRATPAQLLAGAGRAEINPPLGIPLAGYFDRGSAGNIGVHDTIHARALVLESGGRRAGLVCADILLVTIDLREELLGRVSDLGLDFLSVSATHTHYGIGGYVDNTMAEFVVMGKYHPEARRIVLSGMEKALRDAASSMKPAFVGSGSGPAPGVTANRRHQGGPTDPHMRVMAFKGEDGSLIALIMNHAIHPTTMPSKTLQISGDNAGRAEAWMEEKHPGAVAMYMNAGLGDQRPNAGWMEVGWKDMEKIGDALAMRADEILANIRFEKEVDLALYDRTFQMPEVYIRPAFSCWYGLNPLVKRMGKGMMRTEGQLMGLSINRTLLLFTPAEISYEIQSNLISMFPEKTVFAISNSNDYYGYVIAPDDYDTGGYESCMNFYGRDFSPILEQEFKTMVEEG